MASNNERRKSRPLDLYAEEVIDHIHDLLAEHQAAKLANNPSASTKLVLIAADVIEREAHRALRASGIKPLREPNPNDGEATRYRWLNEAMQLRGSLPSHSPESLAIEAVCFASDMRTALDGADMVGVGLAMAGMMAAALQGGYDLQRLLADEREKKIEAIAPDAETGHLVRSGASEGGKERARKFDADRELVFSLAPTIWATHPEWSAAAVARHISKTGGMKYRRVYGYVRACKRSTK